MHKHVYVVSPDYFDPYPVAAYTSLDTALREARAMARIAHERYVVDALAFDVFANDVVDEFGVHTVCEVCKGPSTAVEDRRKT